MNSNSFKSVLYSTGSYMRELISKMFIITKNSASKRTNINMNEILFYGADDKNQSKQVGLDNLLCIYFVVMHATRTVDVCMPNFISKTITQCILSLQRRNKAKIRVIVHNIVQSNNLRTITENGIEVRMLHYGVPLEHEFILVDASGSFEDAVAMIGSLDYDTNRVNCNRDATLLSSETIVIETLKKEFDRVWHTSVNITFKKEDKDYSPGLVESDN